ncbi:MAG TPA: BamA/TamA family outer membrane protein [Chryseolinea sp.]|nr:BamA/TamA family outer membrane protein [Chryseolinea sp.]
MAEKNQLFSGALIFLLLIAHGFANGQDSTAINKQKRAIAAIPMFNYNRTQGIVVGALLSGFYKVNKKDLVSPSSNTGLIAMYTEQKSYALLIFSRLYLAEDRWRIVAAAGALDINFQFYLEDPALSAGNFYDYSTKANMIVLQAQRKIFRHLYLGPTGTFIKSTTTFGIPDVSGQDSVSKSNLNSIGYILSNDTRDHVQYPTRGMFVNFKNQFYGSWVGSDYGFERYVVTYNHFFKVTKKNDKQVLAVRASLNIASGDVPFEGQSVVGGDDIRGYSQGKYRNDHVYTMQAEYRWNFYKRWGMVGFAGVASAVEHLADIPDNEILLGVGAGLRFMMLPSEKINIGVDYGVGKDDYSITFRIGEAFGR